MITDWKRSVGLFCSLLLAALLTRAMVGCAGELPAPCDTLTLTELTTECRSRVRAECSRDGGAVDESCSALKACDKRIDAWHACDRDAGAP